MQETNQALQAGASSTLDTAYKRPARTVKNDVVYYDDTIRWPIWQSALLALGICGAFWGGVAYLCLRLFGA